ncbi:MAG: PAS domain-containing protein [Alphaproteobacteria bacterium]|nr:PAS domain-containing protein [Alphaproteobacteria bacterium]
MTAPSVTEISGAIRSPAVRAAYDFWMSFWTTGKLPNFDDIDPADIKEALPYVWVLKYEEEADRFTYRVVGEEVNRFYRRNMSGQQVDVAMSADLADTFKGRSRRVVRNREALHLVGKVYRLVGYDAFGERIYLPLAASRSDDRGVLGVTDAREHIIDERILNETAGKIAAIRDGAYQVYDAAPRASA